MKKINLYNLYLGVAIIVLIILSSISFYFVAREKVTQKYISNETYLSMFYDEWREDNCKYDEPRFEISKEKNSEEDIKQCINDLKNEYLNKREYRYKFNIIKYGVLLSIVIGLLSVHSVLYIIRKK